MEDSLWAFYLSNKSHRTVDCSVVEAYGQAMARHSERMGSGGRAVERLTINREDGGSIPPTAVSKLRYFRPPHICLCLSEETLKAGGPFYLVSIPGKVKNPTQWVNA